MRQAIEREGRTRGLTLIELVVAMSVFALVAIMGLQSLTGTLRQRDRAGEMAEDSIALGRAVALVRRDMAALMPLRFFLPGAEQGQSALRTTADGVEMSVAVTQVYAPFQAGQLAARVEYLLDRETGQLRRAEWATAWPVNGAARGPEAAVIEGVTGIRLRSYWGGIGWIDGAQPAALSAALARQQAEEGQDALPMAREVYSDVLPLAIEITLQTDAYGEIRIMEALQ